jgi:ferrochelatase
LVRSEVTTGIVMLNLGGPQTLADVGPFLERLFLDRDIIQMPVQSRLGPLIARRRTPRLQRLYTEIGGGSPLRHWTAEQGRGMVERLDRLSPGTAPHGFYLAFRYTDPLAEAALSQLAADGVRRAVAFSQYPQFSCSTTGSSLSELWRQARRLGLQDRFRWSVLDRWGSHPAFVRAMAAKVREGLAQFDDAVRADVVIVFSAHSLPVRIVNRGDAYLQEVAASVQDVMRELSFSHQYLLSFQADVGPVSWQGPGTASVIRALGRQGRRHVLVVGVVFTSDHLDTLHEIDHEFAEVAAESGVTDFRRAPALNADPLFLDGLAEMVAEHLAAGEPCSRQFRLRCAGCANATCREILSPVTAYRQPELSAPRAADGS